MSNTHQTWRHLAGALLAICACNSGTALAAPGNSTTISGQSQVEIVEPSQIQVVNALRFGGIMQPVSGGTITVRPNGTFVTSGGVTGNTNTAQPVEGRGPASFIVNGDPNRLFITFLPGAIPITNGSSNMTVDTFRANTLFWGFSRFNASGQYNLNIGGRLNVNASQEPGTYSGTFDVTVLYL